jgi:fatty acid desaturase
MLRPSATPRQLGPRATYGFGAPLTVMFASWWTGYKGSSVPMAAACLPRPVVNKAPCGPCGEDALKGETMDLQVAVGIDGAEAVAARRTSRAPVDLRANVTLIGIVSTALLIQLFAWPLLLRHWGASALWVALPLVVLTPMHWGLIHESIHGKLVPQPRVNEWVGRALAIAFMLPFDAVRFGHLMHHRFTRESYDRPDVHDGKGHRLLARIGYYAHLLGGLYLAEVALPLLTLLPSTWVRQLVARKLRGDEPRDGDIQRLFVAFAGSADRRARIRRDGLLSIALHACAFYLYGAWWPVLAVTMFLRGLWLSLADNLPHYDVLLEEPERARNFRVAAMWRPLLMNHHLHRLHHQYPALPWTELPALARTDAATSAADAGYFRAALRQLRGFGRVR